jgi:hypothetical protein
MISYYKEYVLDKFLHGHKRRVIGIVAKQDKCEA